MNKIIEAIKNRRSVKLFDPEISIEDSELREILDVARHAPTAFNLQNVRFLVVRDAEQCQKIRQSAWDQPQITDSAALIIMCADMKAWEKDLTAQWANVPAEVRALYIENLIPNYYENKEVVQRDEAFRSCGLASYALMMAASAYGWQTCPMDGFDFDAVKQIINLPKDHELVMFVALGKQLGVDKPHPGRISLDKQLVFDKF